MPGRFLDETATQGASRGTPGMIARTKTSTRPARTMRAISDARPEPPTASGEISVRSGRAAIDELTSHLNRQQYPQVDIYAVRILLSEALPVAREMVAPGESIQLRFYITRDCARLRIAYCTPDGHAVPPWRLCRRRCRKFSQLSFLPLFSTAHRIEEIDGSLTILRACRAVRCVTPIAIP